MEGARIADQGRGLSKEGIAGFAAAFAAVRRGFRLRGNFGKHNDADLHVSSDREYAAIYWGTEPPGKRSGGPGNQKTGTARRSFEKPRRTGRESTAAAFRPGRN